MQPGDILPLRFDFGLIALSLLISVLGSYVGLLAASRIRSPEGAVNIGYVLVSAIAFGGVGIWGMHFIGMIAQVIPIGVAYGLSLTLLSLLIAVFFSGLALWYVGSFRFSLMRCFGGGILAGLGVVGMHHIGMASIRMPAYFDWSAALIVASIFIAILTATVALWLAFNVNSDLQRLLAAIVMAVAVCGMHYTGAAAGTIVCTTPREFSGLQLDGALLPYAIFLISVVTLIVMRIELRRSSQVAKTKMAERVDSVLSARKNNS